MNRMLLILSMLSAWSMSYESCSAQQWVCDGTSCRLVQATPIYSPVPYTSSRYTSPPMFGGYYGDGHYQTPRGVSYFFCAQPVYAVPARRTTYVRQRCGPFGCRSVIIQ